MTSTSPSDSLASNPSGGGSGVDVVYLAACSRDARLTRICLASIRYFHPDVPIKILAGDILQAGLARELKKYWDVDVVPLPVGDFGWGMVKLEPLFGPKGQRFMVCDVDTVFTGPVLDLWQSDAQFLVDNEQLPDAEFKRLYYDWDALGLIDPEVQSARKAFNVGQWFGTAGIVERDEFDDWIEWTLPRILRRPDVFMGGDQGIMNYIVLKHEAFKGLTIERTTMMRWPGNGMSDLTAERVRAGEAPPLVIHWAGLKSILLGDMIGSDLLHFYEDFYYSRMSFGRLRRRLDIWRHCAINWTHRVTVPMRLRFARLRQMIRPKQPGPLVKVSISA